MNSVYSADIGVAAAPPLPRWLRAVRVMRSGAFLLGYFTYLLLVMGLPQRLVVFPLVWLMPARRSRILAAWVHFHARASRLLIRIGTGVRMRIEGSVPDEPSIVVMNHQSVIDPVIALCVARRPIPLIPVRTRYFRGFPGISPYLRAARYPFITQKRGSADADLASIAGAAERAARGEATFFIFPEGHRTRTGEIGPFMIRGIQLALTQVKRPVYCIVGDGMWRVRTLTDVVTRLAGTVVTVRVIGPFTTPDAEEKIPEFIASLRDRMIAALRESRAMASSSTRSDADVQRTAV